MAEEHNDGVSDMRSRFKRDLRVETQKPEETQIRIIEEGKTIDDYYELGERIGTGGAQRRVVSAKRIEDGKECVVKIRQRGSGTGGNAVGQGEMAWRTVTEQLLGISMGLHILKVEEILEDDGCYYIVMEKCSGGELFEFLLNETEVPEAECKRIMCEILEGLDQLHSEGIIHRDVKPENIMFTREPLSTRSPEKTVKLIDFDTCQQWSPKTPKATRIVGTPGYIAPESLIGEYSPRSDLWGVGVILYILMTGDMPWGNTLQQLEDSNAGSAAAKGTYEEMRAHKIDWDCPPWPEFPLARHLCQRLLAFDPNDRPASCQEALNHLWLKEATEPQ